MHEERAQQASETLSFNVKDRIFIHRALTDNHCESGPILLNFKQERQDNSGPVPGGFLISLLVQHPPGQQLGPSFWLLERPHRDKIRQAALVTWESEPAAL